jgi:hypothetical protein
MAKMAAVTDQEIFTGGPQAHVIIQSNAIRKSKGLFKPVLNDYKLFAVSHLSL